MAFLGIWHTYIIIWNYQQCTYAVANTVLPALRCICTCRLSNGIKYGRCEVCQRGKQLCFMVRPITVFKLGLPAFNICYGFPLCARSVFASPPPPPSPPVRYPYRRVSIARKSLRHDDQLSRTMNQFSVIINSRL